MHKKVEHFALAGIGGGTLGQIQAYLQQSLVPALNRFVDDYNGLVDEFNPAKGSKTMTIEEVVTHLEETDAAGGQVDEDFFADDNRAGIKKIIAEREKRAGEPANEDAAE